MICLIAGVASCTRAYGAPPPGVTIDPALHEWFERQVNQNHGDCCKLADGHILEQEDTRIVDGHYEVRIENYWYPIQPYMMRLAAMDDPNPTGKPIVWYSRIDEMGVYYQIYCFAPGYSG